jgi:hypothetical protein
MFDTPILFLIYKRPDSTLQVFEEIRKIKPRKLFVVADGPKSIKERPQCLQARDVILKVDWDCEVKTLFREKNLGSKYSVSSGINWFFSFVDEGIILEDDCVPNEGFFLFCEELLNRYRDNTKIMHITGVNLNDQEKFGDGSYYFSNYPHIWGWATWKRAWTNYDLELEDSKFYYTLIKKKFKDPFERRFWQTVLRTLPKLDAWDYQWMFSIWKAEGICINTNNNFIINIGFNEDATHTVYENPYKDLKKRSLKEIIHPREVIIDNEGDKEFIKTVHNVIRKGYPAYFLMRGGNLVHKIKLLLGVKKK